MLLVIIIIFNFLSEIYLVMSDRSACKTWVAYLYVQSYKNITK